MSVTYKVCIDPGHGGEDRYNRGKNGYVEADGVLDISLKLRNELKKCGFYVLLTRETDKTLSLTERASIANKWGADLMISEHSNAAGSETAKGVEVIHSIYGGKGKEFADMVYDEMIKLMSGRRVYSRKGKNGDYYAVIRKTDAPCVIIESGFHTNLEDEKLLLNPNFRTQIAKAQAKAVCELFGVKYIDKVEYENKTEHWVEPIYKELHELGIISEKRFDDAITRGEYMAGLKKLLDLLQGESHEPKEEPQPVPKPKEEPQPILTSKEKPKYRQIAATHILEVDPLSLTIEIVKKPGNQIQGDFVNGGFFGTLDGMMVSVSTLVSDGKILAEQLAHDDVKRGTLVVYKDGTTQVEMIDFISKHPKINDIKFAVSGFNLNPLDIKGEWFNPEEVGYSTQRVSMGYHVEKKKVIIAIRNHSDAERAVLTMKNLGCDHAICLDSGGSANARFNGKSIVTTDRKLYSIIRWQD